MSSSLAVFSFVSAWDKLCLPAGMRLLCLQLKLGRRCCIGQFFHRQEGIDPLLGIAHRRSCQSPAKLELRIGVSGSDSSARAASSAAATAASACICRRRASSSASLAFATSRVSSATLTLCGFDLGAQSLIRCSSSCASRTRSSAAERSIACRASSSRLAACAVAVAHCSCFAAPPAGQVAQLLSAPSESSTIFCSCSFSFLALFS